MLINLFFRKNIRNLEDAQLLDMVRQQNKEALGELFQRYSFLVFGLCLKYFKDKMKAEDQVMIIFEKLPEKIAKSEISNFKSWLYSVSRNECLMVLRKKDVHNADIETTLQLEEDTSEEELRLSQLKEDRLLALEEAIGELKEEQRKCIELFYLQKKSYDEVAALTKYDLKKVKSYIQNGKRNLNLILRDRSEFKGEL